MLSVEEMEKCVNYDESARLPYRQEMPAYPFLPEGSTAAPAFAENGDSKRKGSKVALATFLGGPLGGAKIH